MTADQKLQNVEDQFNFLQRQVGFISCPYCGKVSADGTVVDCCQPLSEAIAAVMHRKVMLRQLEKADQIAQNVPVN